MTDEANVPVLRDRSDPVLVELFTSQGCSSCPPADELLRDIDERTDVDVIALSFHVDYWNYIGWRDPYSSKAATKRQQAYAAKISQGRAYTPQLVIDGRAHVLGSSAAEALSAIEAASQRSSTGVRLATTIKQQGSESLHVHVEAEGLGARDNLFLVIYESGLLTKVMRGENRGRKIRNDYVVRHFMQVQPGPRLLKLDADWNREHLGVVVFAQDSQSLHIEAVHRREI